MSDTGKAALLVSFAALVLSAVTFAVGQLNRIEDQRREERLAQADLHYVNGSFRMTEDGYTTLTFENKSTRAAAAITCISYQISDPAILQQIAERDPLPQGPMAMSQNGSADAIFRQGAWISENAYEFYCCGGFNIKAGDVGDVKLKIINDKWPGFKFEGNLEINYNGPSSPYKLSRVAVYVSAPPRQQKQQQPPKGLLDRLRP